MGLSKPVSVKQAKLLKEKGFDEPCRFVHDNWNNIEDWYDKGGEYHRNSEKNLSVYYSAPTIAEVVMWLYEKHGIWISVDREPESGVFFFSVDKNRGDFFFDKGDDFNSPTEAYESAIEYCLTNLI